jgi:hypothetical protein
MIKMERCCGSLRCDVIQEGIKIGHMDGVNLTQWFVKNRYHYTGTFSRFITLDPDNSHSGITIDIAFLDKPFLIKNARVEWMKSPMRNGTFHAEKIESHEV